MAKKKPDIEQMAEKALDTGIAQRTVVGQKTVTFNEILIVEPSGATRTELEPIEEK